MNICGHIGYSVGSQLLNLNLFLMTSGSLALVKIKFMLVEALVVCAINELDFVITVFCGRALKLDVCFVF